MFKKIFENLRANKKNISKSTKSEKKLKKMSASMTKKKNK